MQDKATEFCTLTFPLKIKAKSRPHTDNVYNAIKEHIRKQNIGFKKLVLNK